MNARDELIQMIWDEAVADRVRVGRSPQTVPVVRPKVEAMADRILAAGYRKREFSVDEATSERAARALFAIENPEADWEALPLNQWITDIYRKRARVVLAAAMGGEA